MDAPAVAKPSDRQRETLVVIGNGPVGHAFLENLVRRDCSSWRVIVFGEEPRIAYDRVNLTTYFSGRGEEELAFESRDWYAEHDIELHTGDPVIHIDTKSQIVHTLSGKAVHFHRLVLATGSRPFVPPIPGIDQDGIFLYRKLDDLVRIKEYANNVSSAAVMGGGLLGLEAAKALHDMGLETHVVEMAPALMPRQLDNQAAELLREQIEKLDVKVHLLKRTDRIDRVGDLLRLHFDNAPPLTCNMIVVSAGIRPRDELAKDAGLKKAPRGGFEINDQLQTNDPRVYAIGECASHKETIYGLIAPGRQMASILAENLTGGDEKFVEGDNSTTLKLMGVNVTTLGDFLQDGESYRNVAGRHENRYRKLILRRNRIVGAVIVGDDPELPRIHESVLVKRRLWFWQKRRFETTGYLWPKSTGRHVSDWPAAAIVCSCMAVSQGTLVEAERSGCGTVSELSAKTKAGTVCGSCQPLLAQLVGETVKHEQCHGTKWLLSASVVCLIALIAVLLMPSLPVANTVTSSLYAWNVLLESHVYKQITGYGMLFVMLVALTFSLRKRWSRIRWGGYGTWRTLHATLGVLTIVGTVAHTGLRFGTQLNFALLVLFLGINATGAFTGVCTSLENSAGPWRRLARSWRGRLTQFHIWAFWPLPVLLAFHIFAAYYFH